MGINGEKFKKFIKPAVVLAVVECLWLFVLPPAAEYIINSEKFKNFVSKKTPVNLVYENAKFKTYIIPAVSVKTSFFSLNDKQAENRYVYSEKPFLKIRLLPLLTRKLSIDKFSCSDIVLNISADENGEIDLVKLFKSEKKSPLKINTKHSDFSIDEYSVTIDDAKAGEKAEINGHPLIVKSSSGMISLKTDGKIISGEKASDFNIDAKSKFPFLKNIDKNVISGSLTVYDFDSERLYPFLKAYVCPEIKEIKGNIKFLSILPSAKNSNEQEIVVNSEFSDAEFDKEGWKNHIIAEGIHKVAAKVILKDKYINAESFSYKADNVNINAYGSVDFKEENPELDIDLSVTDSRTENIAAILPPTLVPELRTIEKIKTYGVFGDIEGKLSFKGKVPKPDITGYIKGRNVHILDEKIQKLHTGTVNLNFDKNKLNMDIAIEMPNNQRADVTGYVYMFRDGVNDVTVKTTPNLDFPLAQKLVLPISNVFNFMLGPIPEMNITSGKGIIDINVQGSPDILKMNGYCSFDKAKLTYNGLFGEIHNAKGRVDFKDDVITVKSERAFVKNNPFNLSGKVRVNDYLDFDLGAKNANSTDVLEIINKSDLLKDVQKGLAVISKATGAMNLFFNIKANIVPVPFGSPPLPPEEAFTDIKVKGNATLNGNNKCYLQGFDVPLEDVKGRVDFTEEVVDLNTLTAISGTSPLKISGTVVTDVKTKVPDVDITVTSDSVNLKDTVKFLAESYLYPEEYPDLSALYKISSKHDLYFKYKAKSVDFVTDKAYAVINAIPDSTDSPLVVTSGRVILDKSSVKVDNVKAKFFDADVLLNGVVKNIDRPIPLYNIDVISKEFNLANLDNISDVEIIPEELLRLFDVFKNYRGTAVFEAGIKNNYPSGTVRFKDVKAEMKQNNLPFVSDEFTVNFGENIIKIENLAGSLGEMPVFLNLDITDIYKLPHLKGYFGLKPTNDVIKAFLPETMKDTIELTGDINVSGKIDGNPKNFDITPKITLNKDADIKFQNAYFGETNDKRELTGEFNLQPEKITLSNGSYTKYIESQNNKIYPMKFAGSSAVLKKGKDGKFTVTEAALKTEKNLSAKILNVFLKTPLFRQGAINADLKYKFNPETNDMKVTGTADCKNLEMPLFDAVVRAIKFDADDNDINIRMLGFLSDSRIGIDTKLVNNFGEKPEIVSLVIKADSIDNDKLLQSMAKVHNAMENNNQIKNVDAANIKINNGKIAIDNITVKSLNAKDFTADFSIDDRGILNAQNINLDVEGGKLKGDMAYSLVTSDVDLNLELNNVDANYVAETLFEAKNQIYGNANGKILLHTTGKSDEERIKNLGGFVYFDINDGRMPRLGSLEYLLRASNILKGGITGFTLNNMLELLNLVKSGYFTNINGSCRIENGQAQDLEIFSTGENLSMYIHGTYDLSDSNAELEILGKLSNNISTIFGVVGNTSINTLFKLIPGISLLDFGRKDLVENLEKIPPFTNGNFDARVFRATVLGDINETSSVKSFKWVKVKKTK